MTGGSAVFDYGAGLVLWNGERYHCAHLTAQDSYIPNISPNIPGGILLLEISGDCWADGGVSDVACFTGFGTVVICGSGTVQYLDGVENAVFRGGSFEVNQWGDTVIPQLILSGGNATCTDWLPQGTSIEVGAGTMTANGIRYWDTVHVYDGGEIVDLMD